MDSCFLCFKFFSKTKHSAGYNKRRIMQTVLHHNFSVLDVLKKVYNYQVRTIYELRLVMPYIGGIHLKQNIHSVVAVNKDLTRHRWRAQNSAEKASDFVEALQSMAIQ